MTEPRADAGRLTFKHTYAAVAALVGLAALIAGLAWFDDVRSTRLLDDWRQRLCADLPAELVAALDGISAEDTRAPDAARRALSLLGALSSEPEDLSARARILFESVNGWREINGWSDELGWPHEATLAEAAHNSSCSASIERGKMRAVRGLETASRVAVLLIIERKKR